ncbi:hypothetical protein NIES4101_75100 [Calothrix sp. NIES-4101]|nr:hypothetical protein NIES4101_75100 [Calothrix sp. NIES-4101]
MLSSLFSSKLSSRTSYIILLALGASATLTMSPPASAQSSTIIYQRTTTYDNYRQPRIIYKRHQTHRNYRQPQVTNFIYRSPVYTPFPVNPYKRQVIQNHNNFYPRSYYQQRVIVQPRARKYINNSTGVNTIFLTPNIRNSNIINPRNLNPYRHYYGNPVQRNSGIFFQY